MKRQNLQIFLHGRHIGVLSGTSLRVAFQYDPEAVSDYGVSSILLSLSLPVTHRKISTPAVFNYFDGLLPEGQVRSHLAAENGLSTPDTLGLLRILGADCAGAVQALPEGRSPLLEGHPSPLSDDDVVRIVEALPAWDIPENFAITASLGGVQSKVLLSRTADGTWMWPGKGSISTHIIKPEPLDSPVPHLLASEDWALRVAAVAGLPAATAELTTIGTREAIVVARYGRTADGGRVHQEDFTQALALGSDAKYEGSTRPPSRLTRLVSAAAPHTRDDEDFRRNLLRAVTFNLVIGNGDAHSKNYSILILEGGEVQLAPLYDVAPTLLLYPLSTNAGHVLGGQARLNYLTLEHLVREGMAWGMGEEDARATALDALEHVAEAAAGVRGTEELGFLNDLVPVRAEDLIDGGVARRSLR